MKMNSKECINDDDIKLSVESPGDGMPFYTNWDKETLVRRVLGLRNHIRTLKKDNKKLKEKVFELRTPIQVNHKIDELEELYRSYRDTIAQFHSKMFVRVLTKKQTAHVLSIMFELQWQVDMSINLIQNHSNHVKELHEM
jgi:hypothetical protein